jgi:pyruvate dehydrogenase E2 component (dihydrolipoamide acetyltransferase)
MTEECVLSMWRKAEGEPVSPGDVVFEIETEKSTMEVEAFHGGVLLRQVVAAGQTVPVNEICAWIGEPGEAVPETAAPAGAVEALTDGAVAEGRPIGSSMTAPIATPLKIAGERPAISPRARARARSAGVKVGTIAGTGPGGRIVERDVEAAIAARAAAPAPGPALGDEEPPRPLSRMRRVIAERLTLAATTIPTFTATVAVDVTRALALRRELQDAGSPTSVTDLVLAATAQTLAEFPDVNARTDGLSIWPRRRVHLGVAVALPGGLVVAVIRDADRLGLLELHDEAARLVAEARAGRLSPEAMTGSTFTVSNLGMYGIEEFAAIVNPGESGILAVGAAIPAPVVLGEGIGIRTVMRLTLTADHRLVDGELGARFLGALRRRLEDPTGLRREPESR